MTMNEPASLSELLRHERWAVRLARALVGDDDLAADLVQNARIAFWRQGPTNPSRARSWLGTVLRNLARSQARDDRRRQRLATAAGLTAAPAAPSADQLTQRLEGHRLLAALVADLREPFRTVILLRYYEGLSGAEITRHLGVPAGTVRWRLKVALDELRAALDARHESKRENWMALVAGLAGSGDRAPGVGTAVSPVVAARFGRPMVLGMATLAITALVVLALRQIGLRPETADAAAVTQIQEGEAARAGQTAAARAGLRKSAPALLTRAAGEDETAASAELPSWALAPGFSPRAVAGRILAAGQPLANAQLRLSSGMMTHARGLDRTTVSGSDGAFAFPPQPATNWFLTATAPGLTPQILYVDLRAVAPTVKPRMDPPERLLLDLQPCHNIAHGTVKDLGGGAIAGATIKLTAAWNNGGTSVRANDLGGYSICLPSTRQSFDYTLVAAADGYGTVETLAPIPAAGQLDFALEPQAIVAGRVLRVEDAAPMARVKITLGPLPPANPNQPPAEGSQPVRLETESDQHGRFEIAGLAPGGYRLQAVGDGLAAADRDRTLTVAAGERLRDLEVRVHDSVLVQGSLRRAGQPVPGVRMAFEVRGTPVVPAGHHVLWPSALSAPDGRFEVRLKKGAVVDRVLGPWPRDRAPKGFTVDRPLSGLVIDLPPE